MIKPTKPTKRVKLAATLECVLSRSGARDRAWPRPVRVELRYDGRDPLAIEFAFATQDSVTWLVSRDLLSEGVNAGPPVLVGSGDVRVHREIDLSLDGVRDEVRLELRSPSGRAVLWFAATPVQQFLNATYEAVPAGTESARTGWDADAELRTLINGELA